MGTCVDYVARFGGSNKTKMKKALKYIRQIQEDTAEYSGNGVCDFSDEPQVCDDGSMQWHSYCKAGEDSPPEALRNQLMPLTRGGDFHFWFYWDCTDGCNESSLEQHQDGECTFDDYWNSGILGLDGSIAIAKLKDSCDADAAHFLLASFLADCNGQWDDDDYSSLFNAHLAATSLAKAFRRWPTLLLEPSIQSNLADINRKLAVLCEGVEELRPFDTEPEKVSELAALQAVLEAEILKQVTLVPPLGNTRAAAGVRL